jgi:hypothetical protein
METALALLLLTWSLACVGTPQSRPADAALRTMVVYLCRPDAALIPAVAYAAVHLHDRARLLRYACVLAAALGVCLGLFRAYYGTALPLPFYVKSSLWSPYGDAMARLGVHSKLENVATFAAFAAPLVWIGARRTRPPAAALCIAAGVFVGYHALTNSEIMGYRARFYLPALIPLALAAAIAWGDVRARYSRRTLVTLASSWIAMLVAGHHFRIVDAAGAAPPAPFPARAALLSDRAFVARSSAEVTTTRGLYDVARCLPHVARVYHTEIGVVGLVLPRARVVDLAGLMSKRIALEHPPFDEYCLVDRPEVLFLPHKNYAELNREIERGACIRQYTQMTRRSSSPLYVRSDLAPRFLACASDIPRFGW